jgi:hypothetical protein
VTGASTLEKNPAKQPLLQHEVAKTANKCSFRNALCANPAGLSPNQPQRLQTLTPMGCLAQRNQGGARRAEDIRGARYPIGVSVALNEQRVEKSWPDWMVPGLVEALR